MIIVLLGMPGSGKGTQAQLLESKYSNLFTHISLGEIIRDIIDNNESNHIISDNLKKKIKIDINKGELLNDTIVNGIVLDIINYHNKKNIILDGYPRRLTQAEFLFNNFREKNIILIYFEVEKQALLERLTTRLMCNDCQKILSNTKVCTFCKSENLIKREDDKKNIIENRLEIFEKETFPIIDKYKNDLITIDSNNSMEFIHKKLCRIIKMD